MNKKVLIILILGFVLRLMVMFWGYHGDLNNNISWGTMGFVRGLNGFYEYDIWSFSAPNQPPLYILLFVFLRAVWEYVYDFIRSLNAQIPIFPSPFIWFWEERGMTFLVKIPSILADLGIGLLLYNFVKKHKPKYALLALVIWLINPVTWYNSAVWGQTDAIVNLLGLLGIFALLNKKLVFTSVYFTLSILFKGSLAIFVPVLLFVAVKQNYKPTVWLKAIFAAALIAVGVSLWFYPKFDLFIWLINLYRERILPGEIGFLTANAFNFWWLVDPGRTYDSIKFFGLTARLWGYLLSLGLIALLFLRLKKPKNEKVFYALALSALITFLFMSRIHERYLYPFFPVATVLMTYKPKLVIPISILSLAHLMNLYHLFWVPNVDFWEALYTNPAFMNIVAATQLIIFAILYGKYFFNSK